jgi:hypothetical protein
MSEFEKPQNDADDLGSVLFHQGNDHDAESEYRRALAIVRIAKWLTTV